MYEYRLTSIRNNCILWRCYAPLGPQKPFVDGMERSERVLRKSVAAGHHDAKDRLLSLRIAGSKIFFQEQLRAEREPARKGASDKRQIVPRDRVRVALR